MRTLRRLVGLCAVVLGLGAPAWGQATTVLVSTVDGPITPVIARHLVDGAHRAGADGHAAYVVQIDTPGGLDTSMREIVRAFMSAPVPVVVHVAPSGARAASAGAIIGMSAHVLAMAPGTAIGAATPVGMEGTDVGEKVIQDAAAYSVSIARERGRDEAFAREAVTEGRSVPVDEAIEIGVADLGARTLSELLDSLDGRGVTLATGTTVTLSTAGALDVHHDLSWFRAVQQRLADPNLAFLFLSLGGLAIIYELANPGMGLGGILGVIMLLLAFFALAVLPVTVVGVLLLLLALGLFVAEVFVPGIGVFAAGGAISLVLAGIFLFEGELGVDLAVVVPVAVVVSLASIVAGRLVIRAHRTRPTIGGPELVGRTGVVKGGQMFLAGAWWRVRGDVTEGAEVRVTGTDGLELLVEPVVERQEG